MTDDNGHPLDRYKIEWQVDADDRTFSDGWLELRYCRSPPLLETRKPYVPPPRTWRMWRHHVRYEVGRRLNIAWRALSGQDIQDVDW